MENREFDAIVYTSNTGHTKAYAEMLGQKTGIPVMELSQAQRKLAVDSSIIYLGWLMAGKIKGYKTAARNYKIEALCGIGMSGGNSQLVDMRKANEIPEDMPLFYMQGGFEMDKLSGVHKLMMGTMKKTVGKGLKDKKDRTPMEDEMLDMLENGGDKVSEDNLSEILLWLKGIY